MRNPFRASPRAKAEMKKERAKWNWNDWQRSRRRKKMQRQILQSMRTSPWKSVGSGLLAGAASLVAYFAFQSATEKRKAGSPATKFSDPLTSPRFDRKRAFGWF